MFGFSHIELLLGGAVLVGIFSVLSGRCNKRWSTVLLRCLATMGVIFVIANVLSKPTRYSVPTVSVAHTGTKGTQAVAELVEIEDQLNAAGIAVPKIKLDEEPPAEKVEKTEGRLLEEVTMGTLSSSFVSLGNQELGSPHGFSDELFSPSTSVVSSDLTLILWVAGTVVVGSLCVALVLAARRRQRAYLFALLAFAGTAIPLLLILVWGSARAVPVAAIPPSTPVPQSTADLRSLDEELDTAQVGVPRIKLDDVPDDAEAAAEMESFINLDDVPAADRPAWLDAEPGPNQRVFTAGPFAQQSGHLVRDGSWNGIRPFYTWTWNQASGLTPSLGSAIPVGWNSEPPVWWNRALRDEMKERTEVATYTERRETSVGTVYLNHTLAQFDDDDREWFAKKAEAGLAKTHRESAVGGVALGGGALLAGIAVLHGILRSGRRTKTKATASREA